MKRNVNNFKLEMYTSFRFRVQYNRILNTHKHKQNMDEDYECRYERIDHVWPQANQQSQNQEQNWSQDQNDNCTGNTLLDLYKAKERFRQFIQELGQLRKTAIREDVLKYCESQSKKQKNIEVHYKPETILKKIQIRIEKMIKTKRIKRNWGEEDIKILLWIISKYCDYKNYNDIEKELQQQDWKFIAQLIPGVTAETCMFKWLSLKKITLSSNSWSDYESNLLSKIVKQRNNKGFKHNSQIHDWKEISQELYKLNENHDKVYRNAKQCREHWTCYLSPQLKKGPWQLYQDVRLMKFIQSNNGLKKWSEISKYFQGRTQNALKNRYTLIVEKQRKQQKNKHKSQLEIVNQYLEKCYIQQYTSQKQQDHMIYEEQDLKKEQIEGQKYYQSNQNQSNSEKKQHNEFQPTILENNQTFQANNAQHLFIPLTISNAEVKVEQNFEEIFEDRQSSHIQHQNSINEKYPESFSGESSTNPNTSVENRPITPIKVQVFKFQAFSKLGMQNFLKKIQPGIMDSTGKFKKVEKVVSIDEWKPVKIKK